jgi:AcrR family transcriptional regulator
MSSQVTMVETPWGNAGELRSRMLQPIRGAPRTKIDRHQRERLYAAMVALASERGYEAVSVSALIELAGVSRSDFYRHFAGKRECFVATERAIMERLGDLVALHYDGQGSALRAGIGQIVAQPAAARLCFSEVEAAGEEALAVMRGAEEALERLFETAFAERHSEEMPAEVSRAVVGGVREVVFSRLAAGRETELLDLTDELWEWAFGYQPPPRTLRKRPRRQSPRKEPRVAPIDRGERLLEATLRVVATKGFGAATIGEIAEGAGVSLSTFYGHFATKAEAFEAALDAAQFRVFGDALPAYRRAKTWPEGVRLGLEMMMRFFAEEPEVARCLLIEIQTAGPRVLEHRETTMAVMRSFLAPGYKRAPHAPAIAAEAVGGAAVTLVVDMVRAGETERLPELTPTLTYLTLAPFLGAEAACAAALAEEEGRPGARPLRDR